MENDKSLILTNTSIEKIEKQINIGDKILELATQFFILIIDKNYLFQIMTINDYKNLTKHLVFDKKLKNVFTENFIQIEYATSKSKIVWFTKLGKYFSTSFDKVMKIKDLKQFFHIEKHDELINIIIIDHEVTNKDLIFITRNGLVKRTKAKLFVKEILTSETAIKLKENDLLTNVKIVDANNQIVIGSKFGKIVRFYASKIRSLSKNTYGDTGINLLEENDMAVAMSIVDSFDDYVFVLTEKGNVVKVLLSDYRITNRGSKGVRTLNITNKTGFVSHINIVQDNNIYILITNLNNIVVFKICDFKISNRVSEGRKIVKLMENEKIYSMVKLT